MILFISVDQKVSSFCQTWRRYDASFKLVAINCGEATSNCAAGSKFCITEGIVCRWQQMKDNLRNANCPRKAFGGAKKGCFHELEHCIIENVCEKHN
jgi:hypothetical protein